MVKGAANAIGRATHAEPAAAREKGKAGIMAFLRRIGAYLWIGLTNPGPPVRHTRPQSPRA